MFIFIAGIHPRTRVLDDTPRLCSRCGNFTARIQRVDHYFSLFFIPLFPVRRGEPSLGCERCGYSEPLGGSTDEEPQEGFPEAQSVPREGGLSERCPSCGTPIGAAFHYCPQCGRRL